jgi:hypothetical protein
MRVDPSLLFGYDVFISYSRGRASEYARGIVKALGKRVVCFLDEEQTEEGVHLQPALVRALGRSGLLVVVAEAEVSDSKFVPQEISLFRDARRFGRMRRRQLLPVNVGNWLEGAVPEAYAQLREFTWVNESQEAFTRGVPSDGVVAAIRRCRRRAGVRTLTWSVVVVALGLVAAALSWASWLAGRRVLEARAQLRHGRALEDFRKVGWSVTDLPGPATARRLKFEPGPSLNQTRALAATRNLDDYVDAYRPAVVSITDSGQGGFVHSGFFVSPMGHILTVGFALGGRVEARTVTGRRYSIDSFLFYDRDCDPIPECGCLGVLEADVRGVPFLSPDASAPELAAAVATVGWPYHAAAIERRHGRIVDLAADSFVFERWSGARGSREDPNTRADRGPLPGFEGGPVIEEDGRVVGVHLDFRGPGMSRACRSDVLWKRLEGLDTRRVVTRWWASAGS